MPYIDEISGALARGDAAGALNILSENAQAHADDADFISAGAVVYLTIGEIASATELLEKGVSLHPHSFDIMYNLAYAKQTAGNLQAAYHWYTLAGQHTANYDMLAQIAATREELKTSITPAENDAYTQTLDITDVRTQAKMCTVKNMKDAYCALRMVEFGISVDEAIDALQTAINAGNITLKQLHEYLQTNGAKELPSIQKLSRLHSAKRGKEHE